LMISKGKKKKILIQGAKGRRGQVCRPFGKKKGNTNFFPKETHRWEKKPVLRGKGKRGWSLIAASWRITKRIRRKKRSMYPL